MYLTVLLAYLLLICCHLLILVFLMPLLHGSCLQRKLIVLLQQLGQLFKSLFQLILVLLDTLLKFIYKGTLNLFDFLKITLGVFKIIDGQLKAIDLGREVI